MMAISRRERAIWRSAKGKRSPTSAKAEGNDAARRGAADDAGEEQRFDIGGYGRKRDAGERDREADLDDFRFAERIAERAEDGLAERIGKREGGGEQRRRLDAMPRSRATAGTTGSMTRIDMALTRQPAARMRRRGIGAGRSLVGWVERGHSYAPYTLIARPRETQRLCYDYRGVDRWVSAECNAASTQPTTFFSWRAVRVMSASRLAQRRILAPRRIADAPPPVRLASPS